MKPSTTEEPIVVECELEEPREKVWRALTVPEIVSEWLNPERDKPEHDKQDAPEYEIVTAEKPHLLQYRMREARIESTVTFELNDTAVGGTRLRIIHRPARKAQMIRRTYSLLKAAA